MPLYLFSPLGPNTQACSKSSKEGLGVNMIAGKTYEVSDTWAEFLNSILRGTNGGQALKILCSVQSEPIVEETEIPPVLSTKPKGRGPGRPAKKPS